MTEISMQVSDDLSVGDGEDLDLVGLEDEKK
jgi:hypothetical protein